jgi:predicted kinase
MNFIDATNLSPKERHSWIKMAHDFGYEAHAVFFDVPTEVCMERNRKRSRNVPDDVMLRMAQKLRPPKFEEGFAKVVVVRLKNKGAAAPAAAPAEDASSKEETGEE